jgi:EAL domain-containing protein (putative c-di-GMP-specific phosphodiesterase class I)
LFQHELHTLRSSDVEEIMSEALNGDRGHAPAGSAFVLDDEPQIGALVCKVLETCGFAAQQFISPAPFFSELEIAPPALLVLDLSLGQSDAVEIIRRLEAGRFQGQVLLISGRDEATLNEISQIGEKHGLAMLPPLKKPFRPAHLRQRLTAPAEPAGSKPRGGGTERTATTKVSLIEALRNDWLEVWYQTKVEVESLSVCGAEGLIRARHPLYGILTPDLFLPPAGDAGYQPLTRFVIERAMADWARFARHGIALNLSLNAPVSAIQAPEFISEVRSFLPSDPKFPGLTIEVTEDELIRDGELAREVAHQLKLYNVNLSIDDFGAGYASLSRLNHLPFVEMKIDRSLVLGCASNGHNRGLCQAVIDLAHRFGASACAEGVETADDLRVLSDLQCDCAQGFLFAKPMPAADLVSWLTAGSPQAMRSLLQASPRPARRLAQGA